MRRLPTNKSKKHKIVIEAVKDFFGSGLSGEDPNKITALSVFLMGRRSRLIIKEEWKEDLETIKINLEDPVYKMDIESSIC